MKNWYKSKTILIALAQAVLGFVIVLQGEYPEFGFLASAKSIIDIAIRIATTTKIE
jgi:hypothetical protein